MSFRSIGQKVEDVAPARQRARLASLASILEHGDGEQTQPYYTFPDEPVLVHFEH